MLIPLGPMGWQMCMQAVHAFATLHNFECQELLGGLHLRYKMFPRCLFCLVL